MSLYFTIILITILFMIAMTIHVGTYSGFTKAEKTWYVLTFLCTAFCAGAEFLAKHYDGKGYAIPLTVITVIQFSLAPLLPVFFSGALGMSRLAKRVGAFFLLNVFFEIAAAPFGLVFYFEISERCYKKAIPVEEAVEIIKEESGTHFDPKLVEVFLRHKEEFGVIS